MVNNEVDSKTGTILLRAVFPNEDETLWPGQFVHVKLTLAVRRNAVVVPSPAVQVGQQGNFVFVVTKDQTVESRPVTVDSVLGPETVVTQGLQAQDRVVTSGQLRLINGSKVEIKSAETSTPKKSS